MVCDPPDINLTPNFPEPVSIIDAPLATVIFLAAFNVKVTSDDPL